MVVEPGFYRTDLLAPESTSYAESSIDDYTERTKQTVEAWNGMNGRPGRDPAKLATALIGLATSDEPPVRWVAGADAVAAEGQGPARPGRGPPRAVELAVAPDRLSNKSAVQWSVDDGVLPSMAQQGIGHERSSTTMTNDPTTTRLGCRVGAGAVRIRHRWGSTACRGITATRPPLLTSPHEMRRLT